MTSLRNLRGMNPNEVGIIGKPCNTMSDNKFRLEKNRNYETNIENLVNERKQVFAEELKISFFTKADSRAKQNRVKRNVDEIMNQRHFLLNERRSKLKLLLSTEQKNYENELLSSAITPLERAAKLRERAREIRNNKENEKAIYVQQKLDEKWRSECDELRTFESKQLQAGMRTEHLRQIEEKICKERHRLQEEAVFADLWQQDYEAKTRKEDDKKRQIAEKNKEMSLVLKEQMQVLEDQRQEEKRLRNENIRLIEEKQNIEELEKKIRFQKKREMQAERRHELDNCVKARLINEAKRAREEMSYDLKSLEDSMKAFYNEDEDKAKRKLELLEEQKRYREYLKAQYEEEKRKEKELDLIIEEDIERQFQKRLNEWKLQKQARKKLLESVLQERRLQIEEKIERNKQKSLDLEKEKEEQAKLVEYYKKKDEEEKNERHVKTRNYNSDLVGQMEYNKYQQDLFNEKKTDEFRNYMIAENAYQNRLNEKMKNVQLNGINRRPIVNSGFCNQCKDDLKIN